MLAIRAAAALGALLLCLPGHLVAKAIDRRPSPWIRRFLALVGDAFGLDVRIEGQPIARDVLFVANHLSWLDIVAIGGATGARFVSKDDVAGWPVIGWLAREGGTLFVSRTDRGAVREQADMLGEALATGRPTMLFAEGTTNDGTVVLPFRPALLSALDRTAPGVRVQPVAIDYGDRAPWLAWHGAEDIAPNAKRVLGARGRIPVTLMFLDPIDPAQAGGRKAIAAAAHVRIAAALSERGTIAYRAAP